jgi:hypothetical protein
MPKIRRRGVPGALLEHLWLRIDEREVSIAQLELFAVWLDTEPDVPEGKWIKRFPNLLVCRRRSRTRTRRLVVFLRTLVRPWVRRRDKLAYLRFDQEGLYIGPAVRLATEATIEYHRGVTTGTLNKH